MGLVAPQHVGSFWMFSSVLWKVEIASDSIEYLAEQSVVWNGPVPPDALE